MRPVDGCRRRGLLGACVGVGVGTPWVGATAAVRPADPAAAAPQSVLSPVAAAPVEAPLQAWIDSPHRTPSNRERDPWRHPAETAEFFDLRPDHTVVQIWPGRGGWWSEILAPWLRPRGRYVAALPENRRDRAQSKASTEAFRAKLAQAPQWYDRVQVTGFPRTEPFVPPGSADRVLTFRNLHAWIEEGFAHEAFTAIFRALKSGGLLGVEDHRARTDRPAAEQLKAGYVREEAAIALAEEAGLRLAGRSEINANPRDTKDHPEGVWTLPPILRLKDRDREKYLAIGESDRFTLRFVKP